MRGFFVTFEGIEGAGKTTQVSLFVKFLKDKGFDFLITREPGGSSIGDQIRAILLNPENREMDSVTEVFLYTASRAQHLAQLIRPALEEGKIVVCDRFVDSSLAYQGYGRGIGLDLIQQVNRLILNGLQPNLTFLLDLVPEIGLPRAKAVKNDDCSGNGDRIEREDLLFHRRVREGYLKIAAGDSNRIQIIEANQSADRIHQQIRDHFLQVYSKNH